MRFFKAGTVHAELLKAKLLSKGLRDIHTSIFRRSRIAVTTPSCIGYTHLGTLTQRRILAAIDSRVTMSTTQASRGVAGP